ncbi:hypothetical protein D3C81_1506420 [compost metagenome]
MADEVGVAGGIDQVDFRICMAEVHQRGGQRVMVVALHRIGVAQRVAALQRTHHRNRATAVEQGFRQQGLAAVAMPDQGDRTNLFD